MAIIGLDNWLVPNKQWAIVYNKDDKLLRYYRRSLSSLVYTICGISASLGQNGLEYITFVVDEFSAKSREQNTRIDNPTL